MELGCRHENWLDDTTMEFPRFGFWIIHLVGFIILFVMGMRFALRRVPFPFKVYRLLNKIISR